MNEFQVLNDLFAAQAKDINLLFFVLQMIATSILCFAYCSDLYPLWSLPFPIEGLFLEVSY